MDSMKDEMELALSESLLITEQAKLMGADTQEVSEPLITDEAHEALISLGEVKAYFNISLYSNINALIRLKEIKENKLYKQIPGLETWERFCAAAGFTARYADDSLKNLNTLGAEFLKKTENVLTLKELRTLTRAANSGAVAVSDETLEVTIIDGEAEVVSLDDKDGVKDIVNRLIEAKESVIVEKDNTIKVQKDALDSAYKRESQLQNSLDRAERRITELTEVKLDGISADERAALNKLAAIKSNAFEALLELLSTVDAFEEDSSRAVAKEIAGTIQILMGTLQDVYNSAQLKDINLYPGQE